MVDVLRGSQWALAGEVVGGTQSGDFGGGAENRGVEDESGGNASRGMQLGRVMMQGRMEQEHQNGMGAGSMKRT